MQRLTEKFLFLWLRLIEPPVLFLFFFLSFLSLILNVISSLEGSSITSGDQNWFLPIVWAFSETGRLFHPLASPIQGNPEHILIWHGWLMPWLQGHLSPMQGYQHVRLSGDIIALLIFFAYIQYLRSRVDNKYAFISAPAIAALLAYQVGRPELILSAILILYFYFERHFNQFLLLSVTLSLFAVTSPVGGFLIGLMLILRLYPKMASSQSFRILVLQLLVIVPILIYLLTSKIAKIDAFEWLHGILLHGENIYGQNNESFVGYFLINPQIPLNILLIFPLFFIFARFIQTRRLAVLILAIICLFFIWYFSFRSPHMVYNFIALAPFLIITFGEKMGEQVKKIKSMALLSIFLFSLVCSASLGRNGVSEFLNLRNGNRVTQWIEEAQGLSPNLLIKFDQKNSYPFVLSAGITASNFLTYSDGNVADWVAKGLTAGVLTGRSVPLSGPLLNEDQFFILDVQANSGRLAPVETYAECLMFSNFQSDAPTFLGVPIGRTLKDWSFAIIEPNICDGSLSM